MAHSTIEKRGKTEGGCTSAGQLPGAGQDGIPSAGTAGRAALHAGLRLLARVVARVYFRAVAASGRERFPARGPVLVAANHPAAWTDVLVLDVVLGRPLHFLAQRYLYRPRLRGAFLAIHGSLPVVPGEGEVNLVTFHRCHELFDRGEVVALFPEGASLDDRAVHALKPGAARIALEYDRMPGRRGRLTMLPVGITYADRMAFRGEVVVSIGEPLALEAFTDLHARDAEAAIHALTASLRRSLSGLVLDLPPRGLLAPGDLNALAARARDADSLRCARALRRVLGALRLPSGHLVARAGGRRTWWRIGSRSAVCVAGAIPALAGMALHALPWGISELIARRLAPQPQRIAFIRMTAGSVLLPAAYAALAVLLAWTARVSALQIAIACAITALLGIWSLAWIAVTRDLRQRIRALSLQRSHPRLMERARRTARALLRPAAGEGGS